MIAGTAFVFADFGALCASLLPRMCKIGQSAEKLLYVRRRCDQGSAMCFLSDEGVVVVAPDPQPDGTMRAMVLLAVAFKCFGAFRRHEAALVAIAQEMGASELVFEADRAGWARLLGPDWVLGDGVYARSV